MKPVKRQPLGRARVRGMDKAKAMPLFVDECTTAQPQVEAVQHSKNIRKKIVGSRSHLVEPNEFAKWPCFINFSKWLREDGPLPLSIFG